MPKKYRVTKRKKSMRSTKRSTNKRSTNKRSTKRNRRLLRLRGGNYERDVTTRTYEGFPMKSLNKVVTTVPGRGIMSVSAYSKLMEDLDRNGNDFYD